MYFDRQSDPRFPTFYEVINFPCSASLQMLLFKMRAAVAAASRELSPARIKPLGGSRP
jgi:hypothetical protein